jgi:hypothetical protein
MHINIDGALMAGTKYVSGQTSAKRVVEEALRLLIEILRQQNITTAFGKYRWSGNPARSRAGRGIGRSMRLK